MLGSEATVRHPTQGGYTAWRTDDLLEPAAHRICLLLRDSTRFSRSGLLAHPLLRQTHTERERVPPSIPGHYRVPHKPEIESPREWRVKNCIGWGRAGSSQKPSSRSVEAGQMSHPPRGVCVEVVAIPDSSA